MSRTKSIWAVVFCACLFGCISVTSAFAYESGSVLCCGFDADPSVVLALNTTAESLLDDLCTSANARKSESMPALDSCLQVGNMVIPATNINTVRIIQELLPDNFLWSPDFQITVVQSGWNREKMIIAGIYKQNNLL